MAWWNPFTWSSESGRSAVAAGPISLAGAGVAPSVPGSDERPDLSEFQRATWELSLLDARSFLAWSALGVTGGRKLHPSVVPASILEAMRYEPAVYLGEYVVTAPARDPELYYVRHSDPRVVAETEAWLWRLLPELLPMILRAYAYGSVPIVLDWDEEDLQTRVRTEAGERNKRLPEHGHYVAAHDINPGEVTIHPENDRLPWLTFEGKTYGSEHAPFVGQRRAYVAVWDREFGRWDGQGSRRRAYDPWYDGQHVRLWRARYLERSVDPVRVGYAPEGTITLPGAEPMQAVALLRSILMAARNGSAIVLPSTILKDTSQPAWRLEQLNLSDRGAETWQQAVDNYDARMLLACMAPFRDGKLEESLYFDFVQSVATFAAGVLTRIVGTVHELNHGRSSDRPQILSNDVPKSKKRLLTELFKSVSGATHHLPDGKTYTLAELVHPEIVEQLGVKARPVEEAAHRPAPVPASGAPGRPLDLGSGREERRDSGRTDEAQNDTGGKDEDREERAG